VDLWKDGTNLLRDGGSYSYSDMEGTAYFSGTASHNTVQFDDRDQMPRVGRFLFGDWLETERLEPLREEGAATKFGASYRDGEGAHHGRSISLADDGLTVKDRIDGFVHKAVLRWRLMPDSWHLEGCSVTNGKHTLHIDATMPIVRIELTTGLESRYYMQQTELPVLEVEVREPGTVVSEYQWSR
jgi:hypothetical protein